MDNISKQVDGEGNTTIVGTVRRMGLSVGEFMTDRLIVRYVILLKGESAPLVVRPVSGDGRIKQEWALTIPGDTVKLVLNQHGCLSEFNNLTWREPGAA